MCLTRKGRITWVHNKRPNAKTNKHTRTYTTTNVYGSSVLEDLIIFRSLIWLKGYESASRWRRGNQAPAQPPLDRKSFLGKERTKPLGVRDRIASRVTYLRFSSPREWRFWFENSGISKEGGGGGGGRQRRRESGGERWGGRWDGEEQEVFKGKHKRRSNDKEEEEEFSEEALKREKKSFRKKKGNWQVKGVGRWGRKP